MRLRGSVRAEIERCFQAQTIQPLLATEVLQIEADRVVLETPQGAQPIRNDSVIVQIGGTSPSELLRTIGVELVEKRGED